MTTIHAPQVATEHAVRLAPSTAVTAAEPVEVLFPEARRRARRRRLLVACLAMLGVVGLLAGVRLAGGSGGDNRGATLSAPSKPSGLSVADPAAFANQGDLAFVSSGRLFVLDGSSGKLRALTQASQSAATPQFSPNGRWLTFSLEQRSQGQQVWFAKANGAGAHRIATAGSSAWLPNGELELGSGLFRVDAAGSLSRSGAAPNGLAGWAADGSTYAFVTDTMRVTPPKDSRGVERLETASSLTGKRTLWYSSPVSFDSSNGIHGNFIREVTVLPDGEGIVFSVDPDQSDDADGTPLYEVRTPGDVPVRLGSTLTPNYGGTVVAGDGGFVIGGGSDRYAWSHKAVALCSASSTRCTPIHTPAGTLSIDPAWSPKSGTLALVEAADQPDGNIAQSVVQAWYTTHELATLAPGQSTPRIIAGTKGATTPMWSRDGKQLLYVAGNGLWLVAAPGGSPREIVAPLFAAGVWPSYYGEVDWNAQFAWSQGMT